MPQLFRGFLCALGILAAFTAVATLAPWTPSVPGAAGTDGRKDDLDVQLAVSLKRIRDREETARQLIAGRLTLLQTAARFHDLDAALSSFRWGDFRVWFPGRTDGERFCRKVIGFVEGMLADEPERARAVADRLEFELQEQLRRGPIVLPRPAFTNE